MEKGLYENVKLLVNSQLKSQKNSYKIENVIAAGTGGVVFRGQEELKEQRQVAIKFQPYMSENEVMCTQNMMANNFKNVINIYDFFHENRFNGYFVIMELGKEKGNLTTLYQKQKPNQNEILCQFQQICFGVQEIHQRKWIHRDIKPDNIIVGQNGTLKLCDLGLVRELEEDNINQELTRNIGTPLFMAPELLDAFQPYNKKVDIWALGCTLYWMLTKQYLFVKNSLQEIFEYMRSIKQEEIDKIIQTISCNDHFKLILHNCLLKDVSNRVTINQLLQYVSTLSPPNQDIIPIKPNLQLLQENNKKVTIGTYDILISKHIKYIDLQIQIFKKSICQIIQNTLIDDAINLLQKSLNNYFQKEIQSSIFNYEHQFRIQIGQKQLNQQNKIAYVDQIKEQKNLQFQKQFQLPSQKIQTFPNNSPTQQQINQCRPQNSALIRLAPQSSEQQFKKELQNLNINYPKQEDQRIFEFLYDKIIQLQTQLEKQNSNGK